MKTAKEKKRAPYYILFLIIQLLHICYQFGYGKWLNMNMEWFHVLSCGLTILFLAEIVVEIIVLVGLSKCRKNTALRIVEILIIVFVSFLVDANNFAIFVMYHQV